MTLLPWADTSTVGDAAAVDELAAADPAWLLATVDAAVVWLLGSYTSTATRTAYATDLGIPRQRQSWRPPRQGNRGLASPGPLPQSFFRWCLTYGLDPHVDVDHDRLRAWLLYAREVGDTPATLRRRLASVGAWYDAMRRRGHTGINLADLITRQERRTLQLHGAPPAKPTVAFTLAQVRAFQVAADHDPSGLRARNQLIVALLPATGLRAAELCGLDLQDLHQAGPGGFPALWVSGKGGGRRWVRVPAGELALIEAYLPQRVEPPQHAELAPVGVVSHRPAVRQPLLTSASGQRMTTHGITAVLQRLAGLLNPASSTPAVRTAARELAPLAGSAHPHQYRHFYAQQAERNGVPATQIRDDLGHASLLTTQTYLDGGAQLDRSAATVVSDVIHAGQPATAGQ